MIIEAEREEEGKRKWKTEYQGVEGLVNDTVCALSEDLALQVPICNLLLLIIQHAAHLPVPPPPPLLTMAFQQLPDPKNAPNPILLYASLSDSPVYLFLLRQQA